MQRIGEPWIIALADRRDVPPPPPAPRQAVSGYRNRLFLGVLLVLAFIFFLVMTAGA